MKYISKNNNLKSEFLTEKIGAFYWKVTILARTGSMLNTIVLRKSLLLTYNIHYVK